MKDKYLPFFRFNISNWQNGEIQEMSDSCKGVFMDICAYYWANKCDVTEEKLMKKFGKKKKTVEHLMRNEIIKIKNKKIYIVFLSEELFEINQNSERFSKWGKLGQKRKKEKTPLKPPLSQGLSYKNKKRQDKIREDNNKRNVFLKPSIDEIKSYCFERNNGIDFNTFYDFYESKNWMIGKNKMKDWKAAVRTWEKNANSKTRPRSFAQQQEDELMKGLAHARQLQQASGLTEHPKNRIN